MAIFEKQGIRIVLPDVVYEHRFYLALFGAALVLATVVERVLRRLLPPARLPLALWVLIGASAVLLATVTAIRVGRRRFVRVVKGF
mgnify:CR=1 FL=1